ncbi:DUF302 domain-containing protein, partial [Algibacter sp.]|jgi:uncharacterized protein (DUF302 family)|uniref:DUF302 domain-containing protein n=1 Tax=uncultured Algibacter sp. TaxID=298659 RepID=UPI00233D4245|nr:DUF302 domain-containing protein [uncultured Algibacter sp.]MDB4402885.1 DUF302 domain-containing protein [Algibacter sp.]MDC1197514.1 DUF302 domain-containing protein [Algibacter sp.]
MSYYFNKVLKGKSFNDAIDLVTAELKKEGFGILTEIDVKETLKSKIDVDFKKYKILGACNPHFAYEALQSEDKIGVLLPCNVIVQEHENGAVEISAVNPMASMSAVQNKTLGELASKVQLKLIKVINSLN